MVGVGSEGRRGVQDAHTNDVETERQEACVMEGGERGATHQQLGPKRLLQLHLEA